MSTQTLSQAAAQIVDSYHQGAKHLVGAYQAGVERAARAGDERLNALLQRDTTPLANEALKTSVLDAQRRGAQIVVDGLRAGSSAVDELNQRIATGLKTGIERLAEGAERLGAAFDSKAGDTLSVLALPTLQLQLSLANALAQGAQRVEAGVKGEAADTAEAPAAARKPARRR